MARRKRPKPEAQPDELRVFPFELRAGDLVNADGREWQVVGHPSVYRQGKMVEVRLQKPGNESVTMAEHWAAHQRVRVRRL
jgi:hypothetical protein